MRLIYEGRCTNCGRQSPDCVNRGPSYLACPKCQQVERYARRGRVCSVCGRDDLRTVIHYGMVVCPFCLSDRELLYLFPTQDPTPASSEPSVILWLLLATGFVALLVFWLMLSAG